MNSSALSSHTERQEATIVHLNPEAVIEQLQLENQHLQHAVADFGAVVEELRKKNRDLRSQNRMLMQYCEALGDTNRYHASTRLGRYASNTEAFLHFVDFGGKDSFDQAHPWG